MAIKPHYKCVEEFPIKYHVSYIGGDDLWKGAFAGWYWYSVDENGLPEDTVGPFETEELAKTDMVKEDRMSKTREELLEMLDNVSAAAQNMLGASVFGKTPQMSREEFVQRSKIVDEARAVCDAELRPEGDEQSA